MSKEKISGSSPDLLDNVFLRKDSYTAFQLYHASPQCVYRDTRCVLLGRAPTQFLRERRLRRGLYKVLEKFSKEPKEVNAELVDNFEMGVVEHIAEGGIDLWRTSERQLDPSHHHGHHHPHFHKHHAKPELKEPETAQLPERTYSSSMHSRLHNNPIHRKRKSFAERNVPTSYSVDPVPLVPLADADPVEVVNAIDSLHREETVGRNLSHDVTDHFETTSSASTPATADLSSPESVLSPNTSVILPKPRQASVQFPQLSTADSDSASFFTTYTHMEEDEPDPPRRFSSTLSRLKLQRTATAPEKVVRLSAPETLSHTATGEASLTRTTTGPSLEVPLSRKTSILNGGASLQRTRTISFSRGPLQHFQQNDSHSFLLDNDNGSDGNGEEDIKQLVEPLLNLDNLGSTARLAPHKRSLVRMNHKQRGEVLFVRRFLIQIREVRKPLSDQAHLTEFTAQSKLVDRWKEYTVVARHTGEADTPVALYFYKGLEVSKVERRMEHKWSRSFRFKVTLSRDWNASIYSTVDLAVALWRTEIVEESKNSAYDLSFPHLSDRKGKSYPLTTIYIFKAQDGDSVTSWLVFLYITLDYDLRTQPLKVHVTDFDLLIQIPSTLISEAARSVLQRNSNEIVSYRHVISATSSPAIVIESMIKYVYDTLNRLGFLKHVTTLPNKVAMAWRRFDRLLWIDDRSDVNLLQSWAMNPIFDLSFVTEYTESRPMPLTLGAGADKTLYEPPAIEGFCTRWSQWSGRRRRQQLSNVTYLHSHAHMLAFSSPTQATPPLPFVDGVIAEPSDEVFSALPLIWEVAPYKLNQSGHVDWILKCRSLKEFDARDAYAEFERSRRATLLKNADGLIDMTRIERVVPEQKDDSGFVIIFISGKKVHFTVSDPEVRDSWVKHLSELSLFWALRKDSDAQRQSYYYKYNLARLTADNDEGLVRHSEKWQLDLAMADAYTFSASQLIRNRSIIHCDFLYMKDHKYASFRKHLGVLTFTDLLLFEIKLDSTQRFSSKQQMFYRISRCIPMKNAYFYTGVLARDHLMDRDRYFDLSNPGLKALPRAFANGWTSQDTEIDRCLVIWTSSIKLNAKDHEHKRANVFLADSRFRRDRWATAIYHVLGNAPAPKVRVHD